jgi:4-hydroxy-tetrahydrodipicolinate synthase
MIGTFTRRQIVTAAATLVIPRRFWGAGGKSLRGVFPIMSTPFTEEKALDFEDLAKEVDFLDRCGVHGMVWPQVASEYSTLSKEERMRGMEVLAKAIKGRRPALVLGVQGPNTETALEYVRHAETLAPDVQGCVHGMTAGA